jgi:A/G-specific adenine glycosylase
MSVASSLLAWYRAHGRDLPWRHTRDPYRILVSEIMLQQTQVTRGLVFYERWLKEFPTWKDFARAENSAVIKAWSGLGYNRRALMLRDIAKQIVESGVPKDEEGWKKLKGIGPYTAAALSIFSLNIRTLPIDTNIRRVLGRVFLGVLFPEAKQDEQIKQKQDEILPKKNFSDIPQALFDLATLVCTKTPNCAICPLKSTCASAAQFLTGTIEAPKQTVKKPAERRHRDKPFPDRIYRGRILQYVKEHPGSKISTFGKHVDSAFDKHHDLKWMKEMTERLKKEGFLHEKAGRLFLGE